MDPKNPDQILALEKEQHGKKFQLRKEEVAPTDQTKPKKQKPKPMEGKIPRPAETTKEKMDANAKEQSGQMPQVAPASTRPQPDSKKTEEGSVIVAKHLAPQLATDPDLLGQGRWDERKVAVLDEGTLAAMSHFSHRYVYDGVRYWGHIVEWWLTGSQGIGGRGRTDILRAIGASAGVQSVERTKAPNVIARNLWARDWQKKATAEGKVPED